MQNELPNTTENGTRPCRSKTSGGHHLSQKKKERKCLPSQNRAGTNFGISGYKEISTSTHHFLRMVRAERMT